jgi:hypothetical protein
MEDAIGLLKRATAGLMKRNPDAHLGLATFYEVITKTKQKKKQKSILPSLYCVVLCTSFA